MRTATPPSTTTTMNIEVTGVQKVEPTPASPSDPTHGHHLLRLLQLTSSLCPIGAFAYSQGLENAVEQGWVCDAPTLTSWLCGIGRHNLALLDLPLLIAAHAAWQRRDDVSAMSIGARVLANREARELVEQERQLGSALANVLVNLGVTRAAPLARDPSASYVVCYALGAVHFGISGEPAALGYAFAWSEQQVSAAARLIPLGHMATQRALSEVLTHIPTWVTTAREVPDAEIGSSTPALAMSAAWHESQYTRLFRS